jgi:hypothetical protein
MTLGSVTSTTSPPRSRGGLDGHADDVVLKEFAIDVSAHYEKKRQALSCYYSGNFVTGFDHGYVARVVSAARGKPNPVSQPP